MANSRKETEPDPAVLKQRRRNKASRIRTKDPAKITPEETAYLVAYDAETARAEAERMSTINAIVDPLAATVPDPGHLASAAAPGGPELAATPIAPPPTPPPIPRLPFLPPAMPTPPRVDGAEVKGSGRKRWQDKYGEAMGGREMACVMLGGAVHEFCESMHDLIVLSGGRPVVAIKEMQPIFVLAADEILPPHVEATPALIAAGSAIGLSLQALVRRKLIQEAIGKQPKAKGGKLVAMDGGKVKADAPPIDVPGDRAAPAAEQPEPPAPEQPADGRAPVEPMPDYDPQRTVPTRVTAPPGYDGIA